VDGLIQDCEGQFEVKFDLSSLRALPAEEVLTRNPWEKTKVRYRGVLLRDLVTAVGGHGAVLRIEALDDYHSALDVADDLADEIGLVGRREQHLRRTARAKPCELRQGRIGLEPAPDWRQAPQQGLAIERQRHEAALSNASS
jgi:hypothetical protein